MSQVIHRTSEVVAVRAPDGGKHLGSLLDSGYRLGVNTLHRDEDTKELGVNEIGRVQLHTTVPLLCDPYSQSSTTGSFIPISEATGITVGALIISSGS